MDQDPKEPTTTTDGADRASAEVIEATAEEHQAADSAKGHQSAPVVVKKSSGGLAVLLSLVALFGVAYLIYRDWLSQPDLDAAGNYQSLLERTSEQQTEWRQALAQSKQQAAALQAEVAALQQAIDQINKRPLPAAMVAGEPFDPSEHDDLLQELADQLQAQSQTTQALQQQVRQLASQTGPAELSPENMADWDRQLRGALTLQSLQSAQTLLDTQQTTAATAALERLLSDGSVAGANERQLRQMVNQLRAIQAPDVAGLRQALGEAAKAVQALTLPTVETSDEPAWYDRFISVKKIDTAGGLDSSQDLIALKTQLQQDLYQAGLYLTMQQPSGWQATLQQSAARLMAELPQQQALAAKLTALAQQPVRAEIPDEVNLTALIQSLQDQQP